MDNSKPFDESNNNKENQQFNTFDVLSMFLCFMLIVSIGGVLLNSHIQQKKSAVAQNHVENLAQELIMKPVISSMDPNSRLPASELDLGVDPWGIAYKYSVVKNSYGQPIYVVVLSGGPNNTFETELDTTLAFSRSQIENVQIKGDDIGYIKSFR
jgi:beta-glucosidase/6-phospho-beta-glucosidase/beta-galactosidase